MSAPKIYTTVEEVIKNCKPINSLTGFNHIRPYYYVDEQNGHVYSLYGNKVVRRKPGTTKDGYLFLPLRCMDNTNCAAQLHTLVATARYGFYTAPHEVNHINGDRTDNRSCNLEILTRTAHAAKGRRDHRTLSDEARCMLAFEYYHLALHGRSKMAAGEIAKKYDIPKYAVKYQAMLAGDGYLDKLKDGMVVSVQHRSPTTLAAYSQDVLPTHGTERVGTWQSEKLIR